MNNIEGDIFTSIPNDIILCIAVYLKKEWIIEFDSEYENWSYPVWRLYATCKSFSWLGNLQYICLENSECNSIIISRNVNGKFDGFLYQYQYSLMGYYASDKPKEGYNHAMLHVIYNLYRSDPDIMYIDYDCDRYSANCKEKNCILCTQLDTIQKTIFEKDLDVAELFKNREKYRNGYILIREKRPILDFKFDYTGFEILEL